MLLVSVVTACGSDNGTVTEVTLKLRDGMKWHDGEAITADDVIFTLDVCSDTNNGASGTNIVIVGDQPVTYEKIDELAAKWNAARGVNNTWDLIKHAILPAIVLSMNNMAVFVRYIRSSTITQMGEEYVLTAVSKGISKKGIIYGQVLKNCMLPVIIGTAVGSVSGYVGGAVDAFLMRVVDIFQSVPRP